MPISDDVNRAVAPAPEGATLFIRVIPRAGSSRIAGVRDGALLVRLAAAPVGGAANQALTTLLAKELAIPVRSITMRSGARSRNKRLTLLNADPASIRRRLLELLNVHS